MPKDPGGRRRIIRPSLKRSQRNSAATSLPEEHVKTEAKDSRATQLQEQVPQLPHPKHDSFQESQSSETVGAQELKKV